jgi:pyruvate/2-oxoacid:ferredoxin oxidoreductase alpha subunit
MSATHMPLAGRWEARLSTRDPLRAGVRDRGEFPTRPRNFPHLAATHERIAPTIPAPFRAAAMARELPIVYAGAATDDRRARQTRGYARWERSDRIGRHRLADEWAADRVVVMMGSGAETAPRRWIGSMRTANGPASSKMRLYRPFSGGHFLAALPASTHAVAILDRTKEPGALGEPIYLDVVSALAEARTAEPGRARPSSIRRWPSRQCARPRDAQENNHDTLSSSLFRRGLRYDSG